jgi:hypothetical protein
LLLRLESELVVLLTPPASAAIYLVSQSYILYIDSIEREINRYIAALTGGARR